MVPPVKSEHLSCFCTNNNYKSCEFSLIHSNHNRFSFSQVKSISFLISQVQKKSYKKKTSIPGYRIINMTNSVNLLLIIFCILAHGATTKSLLIRSSAQIIVHFIFRRWSHYIGFDLNDRLRIDSMSLLNPNRASILSNNWNHQINTTKFRETMK